jgi:hypothetical protein
MGFGSRDFGLIMPELIVRLRAFRRCTPPNENLPTTGKNFQTAEICVSEARWRPTVLS